jgi:hypothetical protein
MLAVIRDSLPKTGSSVTTAGSPDGLAALPAWPRRPARLGTAVTDALVERIVSGDLGPGTLLPTEPRLCEAFSVSRTVIREAVKILEQKGLVRIKQGQGTTVAKPDEWNLLDPVVLEASVRHDKDLRILDDLVEVRRVLESDMAGQAAERRLGQPPRPRRRADHPIRSAGERPLQRLSDAGRLRSVRSRAPADLRPHRRSGRGGCGRRDVGAHPRLMARPQARAMSGASRLGA